jgi:hypothetical protein
MVKPAAPERKRKKGRKKERKEIEKTNLLPKEVRPSAAIRGMRLTWQVRPAMASLTHGRNVSHSFTKAR